MKKGGKKNEERSTAQQRIKKGEKRSVISISVRQLLIKKGEKKSGIKS